MNHRSRKEIADREPRQPRVPGRLAGKIVVAADFDDTPEDIIAAFDGDLDVRSDEPTER